MIIYFLKWKVASIKLLLRPTLSVYIDHFRRFLSHNNLMQFLPQNNDRILAISGQFEIGSFLLMLHSKLKIP